MNTYWNHLGKYQEWYDELWKQVPMNGKADKSHIDLLRCMSKLYYDHYNNGGCNWDVLGDHFSLIKYWYDQLCETSELNGAGMYHALLKQIQDTMSDVETTGDNVGWADDYGSDELQLQVDSKLRTLDDKWEKLADIIIRYAWEKEHEQKQAL